MTGEERDCSIRLETRASELYCVASLRRLSPQAKGNQIRRKIPRPVGVNPPQSPNIYPKPDDLCVAKMKRRESVAEVCNCDDVQISKMSCVLVKNSNLVRGELVSPEVTRRLAVKEVVSVVEH